MLEFMGKNKKKKKKRDITFFFDYTYIVGYYRITIYSLTLVMLCVQ